MESVHFDAKRFARTIFDVVNWLKVHKVRISSFVLPEGHKQLLDLRPKSCGHTTPQPPVEVFVVYSFFLTPQAVRPEVYTVLRA